MYLFKKLEENKKYFKRKSEWEYFKITKRDNVILIDYNTKNSIDDDSLEGLEIISPSNYLKWKIYHYTIFLGSPRKFEDYNTVFPKW